MEKAFSSRPRLLALDVDGVLSAVGCPIDPEIAALVREIESRDVKIVLASGKPAYYLVGLARGLGIRSPMVIGENGCVIFYHAQMHEIRLAKRSPQLDKLESHLRDHFSGSVWIQPNQVQVTLFPLGECQVSEVVAYAKNFAARNKLEFVVVLPHDDAVDFMPRNVDKGRALEKIQHLQAITREETIAVGDGQNDVPMFQKAGMSIAVGNRIRVDDATTIQVPSGGDALRLVRRLLSPSITHIS
jgi:HAD superfamily hydrolase (TIGR01484 family)